MKTLNDFLDQLPTMTDVEIAQVDLDLWEDPLAVVCAIVAELRARRGQE